MFNPIFNIIENHSVKGFHVIHGNCRASQSGTPTMKPVQGRLRRRLATEIKEEAKESCEMENSEVRFYDVRSSKGRLPFLNKVSCCDACFSSFCISGF